MQHRLLLPPGGQVAHHVVWHQKQWDVAFDATSTTMLLKQQCAYYYLKHAAGTCLCTAEVKIIYCVRKKYTSQSRETDLCRVLSILTSCLVASVVWSCSKYLIFSKLWKATDSVVMFVCSSVYSSIRPPAWNNSARTGRIFMKVDMSVFFENLSRKFVSLTSDKNNGYFTWRAMYNYDI